MRIDDIEVSEATDRSMLAILLHHAPRKVCPRTFLAQEEHAREMHVHALPNFVC